MPSRAWVSELAALLTTGVVQDDPDILVGLARDHALLAPAGTAMALVRERSAEDGLQRFDSRTSAGSRLSRAAVAPVWRARANAIDGCAVLSAAAMDRILRVNPATMIAVVEPGVIN